MDRPLTLTVCSSDPWRQRGVTHLLATEPGVVVVPPLRLAEADVAVVVADRADGQASEMLARVAQFSTARSVLVATDLDGLDVPSAVRYRVAAVLPGADLSADDLLDAVRIAADATQPPEDLTMRLVEQLDRISRGLLQPTGDGGPQLAPRERDLLRLLAEGCDTAEIAARLCYSERTVKNIVHGLLDRLQLRNRTHAVAYALRAGVL